jgi:hypothetical protein
MGLLPGAVVRSRMNPHRVGMVVEPEQVKVRRVLNYQTLGPLVTDAFPQYNYQRNH